MAAVVLTSSLHYTTQHILWLYIPLAFYSKSFVAPYRHIDSRYIRHHFSPVSTWDPQVYGQRFEYGQQVVHRPGNQKVNAYGRGKPRLISEKKKEKEKCVTKKVVIVREGRILKETTDKCHQQHANRAYTCIRTPCTPEVYRLYICHQCVTTNWNFPEMDRAFFYGLV